MNIIKILFLCMLTIPALAKVPNQGIAIYKQTTNVHASLPKAQMAMKAFIPEFSYSTITATFKNELLHFKTAPLLNEKQRAGVKMISTGKSENIIYDSKKFRLTQYGNIKDIDYLFTQDYLEGSTIQLLDESQEINGYHCKKAIDKKNGFIIWYQENKSPIILPSQEFAHIPGIVVKVVGEKESYDLLSIKQSPIKADLFTLPKNNKTITHLQFQDLQEEEIEELMQSLGNGAKMIRTGSD